MSTNITQNKKVRKSSSRNFKTIFFITPRTLMKFFLKWPLIWALSSSLQLIITKLTNHNEKHIDIDLLILLKIRQLQPYKYK